MRTRPTHLIVAALALLATAAASAQQDAAKGPSTVKEVMITMVVPASDVIFTAASEPPTNEAQWVGVQKSAVILAESGKLLMTGSHAQDNGWMDRARALVHQAEAALKAAEAKNSDALSQAGDEVYSTCKACHTLYMDRGV